MKVYLAEYEMNNKNIQYRILKFNPRDEMFRKKRADGTKSGNLKRYALIDINDLTWFTL